MHILAAAAPGVEVRHRLADGLNLALLHRMCVSIGSNLFAPLLFGETFSPVMKAFTSGWVNR